jgi:ferritin-like protein/nucleoside diphosphate kinase
MKKLSTIISESSNSSFTINGFVILKPGFINHENDFQKLLENNDWRIIQRKRCTLTPKQSAMLYKPHSDKSFYGDLCHYMCSDECVCYSCYKDCDNPIKDMKTLKDKVRKQWGKDEMRNAMHSSDSIENVERESNIVFNNIYESLVDAGVDISVMLKGLYADEINAFYQYWIVSEFLTGKERPSIQKKFEEYAMDELTDHAAALLKRMNELNITPDTDLYSMNNIASIKYVIPNSFSTADCLSKNIESEEASIERYKVAIQTTEGLDPTTNQLLKDILKDEEEHKSELQDFLNDIS